MSHHTHTHNCGCNDLITPCTASIGCRTTNYAKCIYYSGDTLTGCVPLTSGENLDVSLGKIVDAICAITPDDLAWNTFDYSCLASYATGQEFAEGISAAHCALVTRVEDLEAPVFTLCSLFTSGAYQITAGTTTLEEILGFYAEILCTLSSGGTPSMSLTDHCFTSSASLSSLEDYIQWIVDNTCSINTSLTNIIEGALNKITAIQSYLGPASTIASKHDNTDCLGGGATDTAYDTIELLKSKVCSIDATVTALPDLANISLSWAPCLYSNTATTLNTQLGRIVTRIKAQNYTFDAGDFTTTVGPCGSTISLNGTGAFACSDLESCSIHSLADVTDVADANINNAGSLTYDNALGYYRPIVHTITVTAGGIRDVSGPNPRGLQIDTTNAVNAADMSRDFEIFFNEEGWLDLTPYAGTYAQPGTSFFLPKIRKTWDGQIRFKGIVSSGPGAASLYYYGGTGQPLNNDSGIRMFSSIPAAYRPTSVVNFPVLVQYTNVGTSPNAFRTIGNMIFDSSTGHITLYTSDQAYLKANMQGSGGTNEYLGGYTVSLTSICLNDY